MIELPDDLIDTAKLVAPDYTFPVLNEDGLHLHSKSWLASQDVAKGMVDIPMKQPGTIWDASMPWVRGHDRPLDAFVEFWENQPRAHHYRLATEAVAVAGALNNIAGVIGNHKRAAIKILKAAKDDLSRDYHLLGARHVYFGYHTGHQTLGNETSERRQEDLKTIADTKAALQKLDKTTRDDIDRQVVIIDKAAIAVGHVSEAAWKIVDGLPGKKPWMKYGGPKSYEDWVTFGPY